MNPTEHRLSLTRREMLKSSGVGIGGLALASLLNRDASAAAHLNPMAAKKSHFAPRAKSIIYMHMVGAPSHLDLWDYKPELVKNNGKLCPDEFFKGKRLAFIREQPQLLGTKYKFEKYGKSGIEVSELLPHLATITDDLTLVKSLQTDQFNHAPAQLMLHTGFGRFGRPTLGSWVTYGLGSENENLPGYVVFITGNVAGAGNSLWGSGFLPSIYQGVEFRSSGEPVLFLANPDGISSVDRRRIIEGVNHLNKVQLATVGDPEIATRISQYEMAYRMQTSVPELMDTSKEPEHVHEMYGTQPGKASFANNCLLARRLVERGVRFVQLFDQGWDHHGNVFGSLPNKAKQVDQASVALVKDLKQRGLLEDTLVIFGGEFGRTPMMQGNDSNPATTKAGRDHHKECFTMWMAGGGLKPGFVYGKSDDLGYGVAEDPMHIHDLNATILHLLGMDHEKLTFKFQGRQYRVTDVAGHVAHKLLA
ncbi:MAG: DUF1501 domain-containing protein [Planctomycetota bacterium]|nr:DUF1501 domain-containing protein [Planctomycetota bacterium]MDA1139281.1 DUF1501 domain-containing protein [Planctomycetota bacterium]